MKHKHFVNCSCPSLQDKLDSQENFNFSLLSCHYLIVLRAILKFPVLLFPDLAHCENNVFIASLKSH